MRIKPLSILCLIAASLAARQANAALEYPDPPGGWTYTYNGDVVTNNANGTTFDGLWNYSNGSSQFDGSTNGGVFVSTNAWGQGNAPGGLSQINENGISYIRFQDCGNPTRGSLFKDPSNRKLLFTYDMGVLNGATASQTYDGITIEFRVRIPTTNNTAFPIDPLFPDTPVGPQGPIAYPPGGDGYVTWNGGKGNITLHDYAYNAPTDTGNNGSSIAFSMTQTNDNNGSVTNVTGFQGLTMNEFAGNVIGDAAVNFGGGTGTNVVPCDPTQWHEFWIVLKADPAGVGTHQAYIFRDGSLTPKIFKMTAGNSDGGADHKGHTYIGVGSPATGQSCALDVDYVQVYLGEVYPAGAINLLPPTFVNAAPAATQPFYAATNNLTAEAVTYGTNSLPTTGATLTLNGANVSSQVTVSGTAQDRTYLFNSLQPNTLYAGQLVVSDEAGRTATNNFSFDTFTDAGTTVIESEDYNYNSGQFIDNPTPGNYDNYNANYLVDFVDSSLDSVGAYRVNDAVDTYATVDVPRTKFTSVGATDYDVELIARGEWCNYTRTITPGSYNAYLRGAAAAAQGLRLDLVTGNRASSNQTVAYLGTFHVPNTGGVGVFGYAALSDVQGNPLPLELSGVTTLRLTAMTANNDLSLNYLVLVPTTAPTAPVVSATPSPSVTGVLPDATVEAAIFDGSSPVDPSSVVVTVNGSVVSAAATRSGSITLVKYSPPALWPVLSSNTVTLAFSDGTPRNASWGFTVAYLPSLTPGMMVGSASTPGFVWRVFQSEATTDPSTARAANELAGTSGIPNNADPTEQGIASDLGTPASPGNNPITFNIPTDINMSGLNVGPWGWPYGNFGPDDPMPGLPGIGGAKDGIAADAVAFLQLPAGVITMPINSDDGFQLMAGYLNDAPLILADQEGLHTPEQDNVVQFIVQQPGLYPFRLLWYQAVQDYAIEWSAIRPTDGVYLLVNDTADGGIPAYQVGTVPAAPLPTLTAQPTGSGQVKVAWGTEGTLQVATSVTGPYNDVTGAVSPYTVTPGGALFFRVRVP